MGEPAIVPIERFALGESADANGALRLDGAVVESDSDSRSIEAQFALGSRLLVILSDDSPYEERLVFQLFAGPTELLDSIEFGRPYVAGWFCLVNTTDAPSVVFTFESEMRYELKILDQPRRRLTALPGVRRRGGPFRPHYLELHNA